LKINKTRLRFYERYGARPIINTRYETPLKFGEIALPTWFSIRRTDILLSRTDARKIVRAILERTYGEVCPKDYIEMIVQSIQDDPVQIREPRISRRPRGVTPLHRWTDEAIALVVSDVHEIHHARERGYVESPVCISTLLKELEPAGSSPGFHPAITRKNTSRPCTILTLWIS